MKVIVDKETAFDRKARRIKANDGCNVCPCCQSTNVSGGLYRTIDKRNDKGIKNLFGIFSDPIILKIIIYRCKDCGCKYESDPFEF